MSVSKPFEIAVIKSGKGIIVKSARTGGNEVIAGVEHATQQ